MKKKIAAALLFATLSIGAMSTVYAIDPLYSPTGVTVTPCPPSPTPTCPPGVTPPPTTPTTPTGGSPKTGDINMMAIELLGVAAVGTAFATKRKK